MFTITGKKTGIIWDDKSNMPLIRFKDGKAETDDEGVARRLAALGFSVEGLPPAEKPLEKRTADELRAYAAEQGIDIGDAVKKPDILKAIVEAESGEKT